MKECPAPLKKLLSFLSSHLVQTRWATSRSRLGTKLGGSWCKSHWDRAKALSRSPTSNAALKMGSGSSSKTRTCNSPGSTTWKRWWSPWSQWKSILNSDCSLQLHQLPTSRSASCRTASRWLLSPPAMSSKSCSMLTITSKTTNLSPAAIQRCLRLCCSAARCSTLY